MFIGVSTARSDKEGSYPTWGGGGEGWGWGAVSRQRGLGVTSLIVLLILQSDVLIQPIMSLIFLSPPHDAAKSTPFSPPEAEQEVGPSTLDTRTCSSCVPRGWAARPRLTLILRGAKVVRAVARGLWGQGVSVYFFPSS